MTTLLKVGQNRISPVKHFTFISQGLSPRVLLVEEAGQVMEAHILGTLVPSIEHLILIGDPLQLRPTLNNYCELASYELVDSKSDSHHSALSMDNRRGRELYKFDMSLMERLSTSGLAMSSIDVQRRMRPTISSLIRCVWTLLDFRKCSNQK